jgi:hypothetical protein
MAFRITATTDTDQEVLDQIRDLAWRTRVPISEAIREAFASYLDINALGNGALHLRDDRFTPKSKKKG